MSAPASPLAGITKNEVRWRAFLHQIRGGDAQGLARLYDETSSLLYGLALRILNAPAPAEEVVVEVYQEVWRSRSEPRSDGSVLEWLVSRARERAMARVPAGSRASSVFPETGDSQPSSETAFQEEAHWVRKALQGLPTEQREAIEVAFFSGLTHAELAAKLGTAPGVVKSRIRDGMRQLRRALPVMMGTEGNR